jgi:hypothetical protein
MLKEQLKEFSIVLRDVELTDTYNGDIPNWIFYVTALDVSDNPELMVLGRFRRQDYRYTVLALTSLEVAPTKLQCKKLVQWQHGEIVSNQNQARSYQNWLHRR